MNDDDVGLSTNNGTKKEMLLLMDRLYYFSHSTIGMYYNTSGSIRELNYCSTGNGHFLAVLVFLYFQKYYNTFKSILEQLMMP